MRTMTLSTLLVAALAISLSNPTESLGKWDRDWVFSVSERDGTAVELDGIFHRLVIGKQYRVRGRLPWDLRRSMARPWLPGPGRLTRDYVALESRDLDDSDPDSWTVLKKIRLKSDGSFDETFTPRKESFYEREFRLRFLGRSGEEEGPTSPTLVSGTLSATADVEFNVQIINDTSSNLIFSFPTNQVAEGSYETGSFTVDKNTSATFTWTNAPEGTVFDFSAQRESCFGACQTFASNWSHKPKKSYTPCSEGMPDFESGQTYYMRVTPQALTSGYDTFIWGETAPLCTGGLMTNVATWLDNHPAVKWTLITVTSVVAVVVAWEGIAYLAVEGTIAETEFAEVTVQMSAETDGELEENRRIWQLRKR
jgi:hypothetical protein